jgi:hypothetical protein
MADPDDKALALEFQRLLDSEPLEQKLHTFLEQHSWILQRAACRQRPKTFLSKISLHKYEIDFALCEHWGTAGKDEWMLVEIERSAHSLFNKSGDVCAKLTHAIRQVVDWRSWIEENLSYARKLLPQISPSPECLIIIGRRKSLSDGDRNRLAALVAGLYGISIHTYDWLLDVVQHEGSEQ